MRSLAKYRDYTRYPIASVAESETLHRRRNLRQKESTGEDARASTSLGWVLLDSRAHRFGLRVVVENLVAHFAAPAGLLVASEGERGVENVVAVDPHGAGGDLVGHAVGFADVARPDAGGEAVHIVIGARHQL